MACSMGGAKVALLFHPNAHAACRVCREGTEEEEEEVPSSLLFFSFLLHRKRNLQLIWHEDGGREEERGKETPKAVSQDIGRMGEEGFPLACGSRRPKKAIQPWYCTCTWAKKKRGEDGFRARTEEEEEILTRHSAPSSFSKSEEEEEARDRHTHHAYRPGVKEKWEKTNIPRDTAPPQSRIRTYICECTV